jgi:hypothetical protein
MLNNTATIKINYKTCLRNNVLAQHTAKRTQYQNLTRTLKIQNSAMTEQTMASVKVTF